MKDIITRAALGRSAGLGEIYNARSDSFCGTCIFDGAIPTETITSIDASFCDIHLIKTDNISEKFKNMGVEGELQASVVAKLVPLEGSGKYLSDGKESSRSVKMSLVYNTKTINESINIYRREYDKLFSSNAIKDKMGTHVVVGISWGANLILSVSYANKESQDEKEISGKLVSDLDKLCASIKGKANVDYSGKQKNSEMKFDFHLFGDVLPKSEILPTDLDSAQELMKKFPSLVEHVNGGKGKPLSYKLLPISTVQKHLQLKTSISTCIHSIEALSLMRIVTLTEQISAAKQIIYDLLQDAIAFKFCVTETEIEEISNFRNQIEIQEAEFRSALSLVLTKVRLGSANSQELESLISKFYKKSTSPENVRMKISEWSSISEKIGFVQYLLSYNVKYIGAGCSYDDEITKQLDKPLMVLFFSKQAKFKDPVKWTGNKRILHHELSSQDNRYQYFAVDCDVQPDLQIANQTSCIQIVQGGNILVPNLLAEEEKLGNLALAYSKSGTVRQSHLPNNRVPLNIKCAGHLCNPNTVYEWVCQRCKNVIEYGFDQSAYCECGKSPVDRLEFKCPDPQHGGIYIPHTPGYLQEQLETIRTHPELNILILGETGVGKSTFINGFCNYMNYKTLREAELGELHSLIPSKFTVYDNGNEISVTTGEDANEEIKPGQSATQTTKVYRFTDGKTAIRLIDTPGIGDTRGIDQDEKNVENILNTISYLDEIHGILILLKPNQSRISVTFRFCIKQLLTNLHKDATENISFCFTNSRSNFYRPGDTMTPLKALLQEIKDVKIPLNDHTTFCFESEAFRYLAAVKNTPVKFLEDERKTFETSWETSAKEVNRLIEHIKKVKPHVTKSTISLNKTRQLVLQLSRPLAEINRNIQMNKTKVQEDKAEIEKTDEDTKKLKRMLMKKRTEIEVKRIDHPRTVCGHSSCKKIWHLDGVMTTEYVTICHEKCILTEIPADTLGDPNLIRCAAFNKTKGFCRHGNCKHHYKDHLHIYYDSIQVQKLVEDQSVAESLKMKLDAREMKQAMINDKNREIQEYENELKIIETTCAKFACFLKCNAITPYNDAQLDYLDYLISEEKCKVAAGCSKVTLTNLQKSKLSYMEEKRILEESMEEGDKQDIAAQLGPELMEKLIMELKGLEHSGKTITDALNSVRHAISFDYKEVSVPPKKNRGFLWFGKKKAISGKTNDIRKIVKGKRH